MVLRVAVMKEGRRVALVPEVVAKMAKKWPDIKVLVEKGAGLEAGFDDAVYKAAGAELVEVFGGKAAAKSGKKLQNAAAERQYAAEVCLRVTPLRQNAAAPLAKGGVLVTLTDGKDSWKQLAGVADTVLALEKLPRTSRAQAMDVLSSQANLGGYAAVLAVAQHLPRLMPQLMTAAGSSKPANVLVLGVGVAGLQAIATARRLGAVVWAFDVRPEVAEQIRSLGAKVVELEGSQGSGVAGSQGRGGYAGAMDEAGMKELQRLLEPFVAAADGVVTTAQVPGRAAPVLVSEAAVAEMKRGSVIVDLAAGGFNKANGVAGGNCPLTVADESIVTRNGVTIVGETDWPGKLAQDASRFWAQNMMNLLGVLLDKDGKLTLEDELVKAMTVVKGGKVCA
ncbi:MAG: NAD(P)(+) transhydrogenase (Re/Si-specific) subunit alpha [Proteobacteria bacterium]|nr:NAD(P)(+) transhydrogenase (Re/Si-specific) subunit alpha [Pseudomonadota bacterium]